MGEIGSSLHCEGRYQRRGNAVLPELKRWELMLIQIGGLVVVAALIAFLVMQRRKESQNRTAR